MIERERERGKKEMGESAMRCVAKQQFQSKFITSAPSAIDSQLRA